MKFRYITIILLYFTSCSVKNNEVKTIKIKNQEWMAKNLNIEYFRNGDPIPVISDKDEWLKANSEGKPASCYFDNDKNKEEIYGKLYNWHAVNDPRGLAPEGWKIPSINDWSALCNNIVDSKSCAKSLKSEQFWRKKQGTNSSLFDARPGGNRSGDGSYNTELNGGYWWSSTDVNKTQAIEMSIYYKDDKLSLTRSFKGNGYSVRCIKIEDIK